MTDEQRLKDSIVNAFARLLACILRLDRGDLMQYVDPQKMGRLPTGEFDEEQHADRLATMLVWLAVAERPIVLCVKGQTRAQRRRIVDSNQAILNARMGLASCVGAWVSSLPAVDSKRVAAALVAVCDAIYYGNPNDTDHAFIAKRVRP